MKQQADALETVHTARRYAAIQAGFDWAVSELREIAEERFEDDGWRAFSEAEVASVQARTSEMAGMIERERLLWAFAQAYVCGMFASAYPDDLWRYFPTMARIDADVRGHDGEETRASVVAMSLALMDLLMLPNEAGWHELVDRNGGEPYTSARYRPWSTAWSKPQACQALSSDAMRSPAIT